MPFEEDGWSSDEEDAEEPVQNPITPDKIKGRLLNIFQSDFKFEGSYYYSQSFPTAPNPGIEIPGFGLLGLPLNQREAKVLISQCSQAPFGKGERTVVDKTVRDTWELSPERFAVKNPQFSTWIESTIVPTVATALGVSGRIVFAEIYKLLVYEEGSHFLAHQDTEKIPGMFGSLIVTLPSQFEGAAVHLSHNNETKVIDLAAGSGFNTSVLAWYSDVFHAVKPVTSGYRLALSYNLAIRLGVSQPRPSAPVTSSVSRQLEHLLLSWKQDNSHQSPGKIVWNLEHQYSLIGMRQVSLKGRDAQILDLLRPLAERLKFRVFLANAELHEMGSAEDEGGWGGGWGYDESDEDDDGGNHHSMMEVEESKLTIENIINLDGVDVDLDMEIDEEQEMIPHSLKDYDPDEEEYEGYQGNYAGTLEHWYRRTVLIIYPRSNEYAVDNRDPVDYAVERLEHKLERGWSQDDRNSRHITTALHPSPACSATTLTSALSTLAQCAIESEDVSLWIDAVRACGAIETPQRLELSSIASAISHFEFSSLRPIFEEILREGKQNSARFAMLHQLELDPSPEIQSWVKSERTLVEDGLKSVVLDDVPALLGIAERSLGDFANRILPQITALKTPQSVLSVLSAQMLSKRSEWPSNADQANWTTIMSSLVSESADAFPPITSGNAQKCVEDVLVIVQACDVIGNASPLAVLSTKLKQLLKNPPAKTNPYGYHHSNANDRPRVILAFVPLLLVSLLPLQRTSTLCQKDPAAHSPLFSLLGLIIKYALADHGIQPHINAIVGILPLAGGVDLLNTDLIPRVNEIAKVSSSTLQLLAKSLYTARDSFGTKKPELKTIVHHIVTAVVVNGDCSRTHGYGSSGGDPYARMIEYCLDFGKESIALCKRVTPRIKPTKDTLVDIWFTKTFSPLWTQLLPILQKKKIPPSTEPFRALLSESVFAFSAAIGEKESKGVPSTVVLKAVGCGCADCLQLRGFLTGTSESWQFRAVKARRVHLEKALTSSGALAWGLRWHTGGGSPQVLMINKPATMITASRWENNFAHLRKFVLALGDAQNIREMLGDRTDIILARAQISIGRPATLTPSAQRVASGSGIASQPAPLGSMGLGKRAGPSSSQPRAKRVKADVIDISD